MREEEQGGRRKGERHRCMRERKRESERARERDLRIATEIK